MPSSTPITPERVDWQQDAPFSQRYGDRYHTSSGAHAQARHVFLGGCELPARWLQPAQASATPATWVMLETGFGLGLNFLSAWALWRATTDKRPARLRFVSTEAHPVSADTIARAARHANAELRPLGLQLAGRWPIQDRQNGTDTTHLTGGIEGIERSKTPLASHRRPKATTRHQSSFMRAETSPALSPDDIHLSFDDDEVELIVLIGDARQRLTALLQSHGALGAHSVFLDGFDPRKNPAIWHEDTLKTVAAHCQPDARLATWSVSRPVRDALRAAGFIAQKRPGLPPKRHCLSASLSMPDRGHAPTLVVVDTKGWRMSCTPRERGAETNAETNKCMTRS
ncbi:MAG: MnmC family methyltransferase [Lautropia sp.]|nr:MnmC family methyltransferase [Lautropia sp.]